MSSHEVKCINKNDRYSAHERITHIGGLNADQTRWKLSLQDAISSIENGKYQFYVSKLGKKVNVIVATHNGTKYLKTENDGVEPNNLLSLPECP